MFELVPSQWMRAYFEEIGFVACLSEDPETDAAPWSAPPRPDWRPDARLYD